MSALRINQPVLSNGLCYFTLKPGTTVTHPATAVFGITVRGLSHLRDTYTHGIADVTENERADSH